ncbi:hypothetical protein EV702DRAFT_1269170, partial [Suillus placidus]
MALNPLAECLRSTILFIFFLLPYSIVFLPSILKLQSYGFELVFTLAALGLATLIANVYYVFSLAPDYFGPLGHNWGCVSQLFNWVILITHILSLSL